MTNNLPQERKDNFFSSFISKIKSWLFKSKPNKNINEITEDIESSQIDAKDDMNSTKNEYETNNTDINKIKTNNIASSKENTIKERNIFLQMLSDNPELLENFSNDKLETLLKEYQYNNEIKRRKIERYGGKV